MRDRNLQADIDRLYRARGYLEDENFRAANAAIQSLIDEKEKWEQWESLQTYKTISLQIREKMLEAAVESIEENIEVLQEKMEQSPWDQKSHYDYLKPPDSDDETEEDTDSRDTTDQESNHGFLGNPDSGNEVETEEDEEVESLHSGDVERR
ncbi:hypothetical protein CkaCkLH20_00925 [Colletotrichum karsti]|uniref:Uncharacterized protein n=1 Tax=Colletotrichum karsti TaxID=1095194 RepID=A0A9P6IFA6_9PEZI|nr:uncharacterized protein CkaCkLH20_00925 [Colletotrichum karsti]KAF9881779.1 hypothetical protein CkaCkLH20_00925 [Colletotrichum karsti]